MMGAESRIERARELYEDAVFGDDAALAGEAAALAEESGARAVLRQVEEARARLSP
ncbi:MULTISPECIES: hypothetical protein [unclassified Nonomuraea]|uniref:hypothetical protein n=1 Tax=unclassified Nonomuraea TaxID=2593643 RepID=UPI0033F05038